MRLGLIVMSALLLLVVPPPALASLSQSEAQQAVSNAQRLVRQKGWPQGIEFLKQKLSVCGTGESGRDCRPLINYSLAYFYEQWAQAEADTRTEQLLNAAESYRGVLADVAGHGPTLHNLALLYQKLGNPEDSFDLLNRAMDSDPSRRDLYATALGDIYYDMGQWDLALQAYHRAAKANPQAEELPLRIVDVYGNLSTDRLKQLSSLLKSWQSNYPEASARGYRLIIKAALADNIMQRAEEALLAWVSLLSRNRRLSRQRVEALYAEWNTPAIEQLLNFMTEGEATYQTMDWWRSETWRRHVLAEAALAVGHGELKQKDPIAAERRWQHAVHKVAPRFRRYKGTNQPLVRLELLTELAALYYQYPELDPNNRKFERLIWSIFRSKGDAYQMNDLRAIQSHHSVLGHIYSRDPQRESTEHRATNSVFQLFHAIKTANKRTGGGEPYQPLPKLKEMLADACRNPSKVVEKRIIRSNTGNEKGANLCTDNGRKPIGDLYLDAAKAYLDTDQLKKTVEMLTNARRTDLNMSGLRVHDKLLEIIETRNRLEKTTPENIDAVVQGLIGSQAQTSWFASDQLGGLAPNFVSRQRFKTIADLAFKLEDFTKAGEENLPNPEIIKPTLRSASKSVVLAGTADQLRVRRLETMGIRVTLSPDCPDRAELADLRWVQRSLNKLLHTNLLVDGRYGEDTRKVVQEFQKIYGLHVDGNAGRQTKGKIRELLCE